MKKILTATCVIICLMLLSGCHLLEMYRTEHLRTINDYTYAGYRRYLPEIELVIPEEGRAYIEMQNKQYSHVFNNELLWRPVEYEEEAIGVQKFETDGTFLYYSTSSPICINSKQVVNLYMGAAMSQSFYFDSSVDESFFTEIDKINSLKFLQYEENSDGTYNYDNVITEITIDDTDIVAKFIELSKGESTLTVSYNQELEYFGVIHAVSSDEVYEGLAPPRFAVYTPRGNSSKYYINFNLLMENDEYVDITNIMQDFLE